MRWLVAMVLVGLLWCVPARAWALTIDDIPAFEELVSAQQNLWVLDDANTISASTEATVGQQLADLAQQKGIEVRFVTVKRIEFGQPVQDFVDELFAKWFPDPAQQANQALILVATEDHRTAIASGERVKSILPEPIAQSIVSKNILLPVQKANYNQALLDGTKRLVAVSTGQTDPGEPIVVEESAETRNYATAEETDTNNSTIVVIVLLVLATLIPMVTYYWFQNQS
jgi:uncharacterized protein